MKRMWMVVVGALLAACDSGPSDAEFQIAMMKGSMAVLQTCVGMAMK